MDALKEHVFSTIQEVINQKKIQHRKPEHALYGKDLCPLLCDCSEDEVYQTINSLCKEGRIKWGTTMHDKYFILP